MTETKSVGRTAKPSLSRRVQRRRSVVWLVVLTVVCLLVGFRNPALRQYTGKTLSEVAKLRNRSVQDTAMDLVVEDGSRVQVVYFLMSEDNVKRQIQLPWVSFGSDGRSMSAEGVFLKTSIHPRAYGNLRACLASTCATST